MNGRHALPQHTSGGSAAALQPYLRSHSPLPTRPRLLSARFCGVSANCSATLAVAASKYYDVVHFGNVCLDIIVPVGRLPSPHPDVRAALLKKLTAEPPPVVSWEVGGSSNFMITAARLGQRVACLGQLGHDPYGTFLRSTMLEEGVATLQPLLHEDTTDAATLLCFVLVDPEARHAFTSRYDFGPWPIFSDVTTLQPQILQMLSATRALMLNGFVLDELAGSLVVEAAAATRAAGGAVFFDPGPRSWTMLEGDRRAALDALLSVSDVILLTQEEAEAITGQSDPEAAGAWILSRPTSATAWAVIKLGSDGAVLCARGAAPVHIDGLKVPVVDTVGCGDSFAAAIALGYTRGQGTETTLALANAVGAATAMSRGAGRGVASAETVMSLLRAQTAGLLPCHGDGTSADHTAEESAAVVVAAVQTSTSPSQPDSAADRKSNSNSHGLKGSRSLHHERLQDIDKRPADTVGALGWQAPHAPALQAIDFLQLSLDDS